MIKQQFSTGSNVASKATQVRDNLVTDGKSALQTGIDIAAGQAALAVLRSFVVPVNITLVDRLTGKGAFLKKVVNSTYGSLALASTFHVVSSIVGNDKLARVAKLALDAAVVEAASTLPIQQWVDNVADKLFNNDAIAKVIGGDKDSK